VGRLVGAAKVLQIERITDVTISYHEPVSELSTQTREIHRAIATLMEELEAVDWYQQRVDVTGDEELKAILAHNRDEEIEHAVMALEWLRRQLDKFDEQLRLYLFTSDPITHIEDAADEGSVQSGLQAGLHRDLGVGNLQR
jgi:uncharacterized protein